MTLTIVSKVSNKTSLQRMYIIQLVNRHMPPRQMEGCHGWHLSGWKLSKLYVSRSQFPDAICLDTLVLTKIVYNYIVNAVFELTPLKKHHVYGRFVLKSLCLQKHPYGNTNIWEVYIIFL